MGPDRVELRCMSCSATFLYCVDAIPTLHEGDVFGVTCADCSDRMRAAYQQGQYDTRPPLLPAAAGTARQPNW